MSALLAMLAAGTTVTGATQVDGLRVEVSVAGDAGERSVEISLADAVNGTPLLEADPLAWLYPDNPRDSCAAVIAKAQNDTLASPAISLNSLRVVTAFADGSLAVLDPQVTFGGTQIESAIDLGAPAQAMIAAPDGGRLLAIPLRGNEALIVDTRGRPEVVGRVPADATTAVVADSARWWLFDAGGLRAIPQDGTAATRAIAWPVSGQPALVASRGGDLLLGSRNGPVGIKPSGSLAIVPLADEGGLRDATWLTQAAQWAVAGGDGLLRLLAPGRPEAVVAGITGAIAVATDRTGRHVLVLDRDGTELVLVDAASGAVVHRQPQSQRFDRITASDGFAYVHSASSPVVQLVSFDVANQAQRISQVELPFGETGQSGGAAFSRVGVMPGGATVVAADGRSLYVYAEGMMVPMGTLSGITRQIVGQAVLDRSLREIGPGKFRTTAMVAYGGRYRLPLRLGNPKLDTCLTIELPGQGRPDASPERSARFVALQARALSGASVPLALETNLSADRLVAIATDGTGAWQRHIVLQRDASGLLRGVVRFPRPGFYRVIAGPARGAITITDQTGDAAS